MTTYRITFDNSRLGRNRAMLPIDFEATPETKVARLVDQIEKMAKKILISNSVEIHIAEGGVSGSVTAGIQNAGTFRVAELASEEAV